jgi:hypothetical protein
VNTPGPTRTYKEALMTEHPTTDEQRRELAFAVRRYTEELADQALAELEEHITALKPVSLLDAADLLATAERSVRALYDLAYADDAAPAPLALVGPEPTA